jgi:hypothetical protein
LLFRIYRDSTAFRAASFEYLGEKVKIQEGTGDTVLKSIQAIASRSNWSVGDYAKESYL